MIRRGACALRGKHSKFLLLNGDDFTIRKVEIGASVRDPQTLGRSGGDLWQEV